MEKKRNCNEIPAFERNVLESKRKAEALKLAKRREEYKERMKMKISGIIKELGEVVKIAKELGMTKVVELDEFAKANQHKGETLLYALKREQMKKTINPVFNTIFSNLGLEK